MRRIVDFVECIDWPKNKKYVKYNRNMFVFFSLLFMLFDSVDSMKTTGCNVLEWNRHVLGLYKFGDDRFSPYLVRAPTIILYVWIKWNVSIDRIKQFYR